MSSIPTPENLEPWTEGYRVGFATAMEEVDMILRTHNRDRGRIVRELESYVKTIRELDDDEV